MSRREKRNEAHAIMRIGWLRAAVLGANDGVLSTSSLIIGVASAQAGDQAILVAGVSGLVAGAMSMAAGEYVSVSSQADSERADLARESRELTDDPAGELAELCRIYRKRGLPLELARDVAKALTAHDALDAHARDELGISGATTARPIQAAFASASAFAVGAVLPVILALVTPSGWVMASVSIASLLFLAILGAVGAWVGGATMGKAALRVTFWGAFAMGVTAGIGALFGTQI
jgi:VIT1/CCC1 family predicted Fe2+/Mn2+ transporter